VQRSLPCKPPRSFWTEKLGDVHIYFMYNTRLDPIIYAYNKITKAENDSALPEITRLSWLIRLSQIKDVLVHDSYLYVLCENPPTFMRRYSLYRYNSDKDKNTPVKNIGIPITSTVKYHPDYVPLSKPVLSPIGPAHWVEHVIIDCTKASDLICMSVCYSGLTVHTLDVDASYLHYSSYGKGRFSGGCIFSTKRFNKMVEAHDPDKVVADQVKSLIFYVDTRNDFGHLKPTKDA
jgi:hypothetical protein